MSAKSDNTFKTVTISAIWLATGYASVHLGFFTLGMAFLALLATHTIVEA